MLVLGLKRATYLTKRVVSELILNKLDSGELNESIEIGHATHFASAIIITLFFFF
jgi:hypothetical protein